MQNGYKNHYEKKDNNSNQQTNIKRRKTKPVPDLYTTYRILSKERRTKMEKLAEIQDSYNVIINKSNKTITMIIQAELVMENEELGLPLVEKVEPLFPPATIFKDFIMRNSGYFTIKQVSEMLGMDRRSIDRMLVRKDEKGNEELPKFSVKYIARFEKLDKDGDIEEEKISEVFSNYSVLIHVDDLRNLLQRRVAKGKEKFLSPLTFTPSFSLVNGKEFRKYEDDLGKRFKQTNKEQSLFVFERELKRNEMEEIIEKVLEGTLFLLSATKLATGYFALPHEEEEEEKRKYKEKSTSMIKKFGKCTSSINFAFDGSKEVSRFYFTKDEIAWIQDKISAISSHYVYTIETPFCVTEVTRESMEKERKKGLVKFVPFCFLAKSPLHLVDSASVMRVKTSEMLWDVFITSAGVLDMKTQNRHFDTLLLQEVLQDEEASS